MNRLSLTKRTQILGMLIEGMGIRATARLADVSPVTVLNFLRDMGEACSLHQNKVMRNLKCKRIQVDEIWSFVYAKQRTVREDGVTGYDGAGDVWTWTAIDADTKLVPCWMVGSRDAEFANEFILDLSSRLANKVQLTSDGLKLYVEAVDEAFGSNVNYAQLIKLYGEAPEGARRYSPAAFVSATRETVTGNPDTKHISTSHVERQNLTMRMHMRRFTRLTNGFSKKIENHEHAVALHYMYYNFGKIHQSLRVTPAMEGGIAKDVWSLEEIAALAK